MISIHAIDYNYSQDKKTGFRIPARLEPDRSGMTETRRNAMTKTIPLAEAKKSLSAIVRDVDEKYDRFAITRNGVEKAVIISSEEFEGLMETLDILSRKEEREAIARAKKQVGKGKTVSLRDFKSRLKLK